MSDPPIVGQVITRLCVGGKWNFTFPISSTPWPDASYYTVTTQPRGRLLLFTESEETCVVYGMPGSVVEAGLSDKGVPLGELADAIREVV